MGLDWIYALRIGSKCGLLVWAGF
ncbi:unnamed protein product [Linum tenue]|uniref:Uncharacterized protein n=1 Tax=Linum tenue TaxID=586396 RepID=A0AAV0IQZ6_9ROSI|nr:unnamed protein product [Linum tenue]